MSFTLIPKSERNKMAESVFLDPANRLFPVRSATELTETAGLLGKMAAEVAAPLRSRIASIATGKGWKLPADFGAVEFSDEALFTAEEIVFELGNDSYVEGDYVIYPSRKLFPAGWYESHNFGMTPEELTVAAFGCPMAPLDLDHKDTVIRDEYIGHGRGFTGAWEGEDWVMRGDIAIHSALDPLLKDETKMSTTWNRDDKSLQKIALLLNPRIPDAALKNFAGFAAKKHTTNTGKTAIQNLHDHAVRGGAVCNADNAAMASKAEHKAIQDVHDTMVAAGASCESEKSNPIWSSYYSIAGGDTGEEEVELNVATATKPGAGGAAASEPATALAAEMAEADPRIAAMQKQIEDMAASQRRDKAAVAFGNLFRQNRILPRSQGQFEAAYAQALADDERDAVSVKFGDKETDTASRADLLKALFEGIVPHRHSEEMLKVGPGTGANVLMEGDEADTDRAATRKRMSAHAVKFSGGKAGDAK